MPLRMDVDLRIVKRKKKNFCTTRQLVTLSVVRLLASESCSGDSFCFTHHPLVTLKRFIILI